ncbi:MAG: hypothetical protein HQL77_11020 [Magnetococcales bacterium]|nr:hypothetical protein [Magnetococcales bacterium]
MAAAGVDFDVHTSWNRERLNWAVGISRVTSMEVRNETELASVAQLARSRILGQTMLKAKFPGYRYGKANWFREQKIDEESV